MFTFTKKVDQQIRTGIIPTIIFSDIDGTLSTNSLPGFIANKKTAKILKNNMLPYMVLTGRTHWYRINELELKLYGLQSPDGVIIANGSSLLWRNPDGNLETDYNWQQLVEKKWERERIKQICNNISFPFRVYRKKMYTDKPLFLYSVHNAPVNVLFDEIDKLRNNLPQNVRIDISESLIFNNSAALFSGGIFVLPQICGKAGIINYMLSKISSKNIRSFIFGDACIDIPMLSIHSTQNKMFIQCLVHPTPLAKKLALNHPMIRILDENGPQAIYRILKSHYGDQKVSSFSPAQNNPVRKFLLILEPLLDKIINKNLSPNDISFLGLEKVLQGLKEIQNGSKIKGLFHCAFGNFTDILDGIRARRFTSYEIRNSARNMDIPGQLVDIYCDRAREFYQLLGKGNNRAYNFRIKDNGTIKQSLTTMLSALSCFLPSLARAQAEAEGITVKERDEKGGSSLDRTILLFYSLIYSVFGKEEKSFEFDKKIYDQNLTTYNNRITQCPSTKTCDSVIFAKKSGRWINQKDHSRFKINALERFLLLVRLLQEGHKIIEEKLNPYEDISKEFKIWQKENINKYLSINIKTMRKRYYFKSYNLLSLYKIRL